MIFGGLRKKILENNVKNNRLSKIKKIRMENLKEVIKMVGNNISIHLCINEQNMSN